MFTLIGLAMVRLRSTLPGGRAVTSSGVIAAVFSRGCLILLDYQAEDNLAQSARRPGGRRAEKRKDAWGQLVPLFIRQILQVALPVPVPVKLLVKFYQ
jgi:hypothetical protein